MKNKDLIAKLKQFDPELEVAILDWKRNELGIDGDGDSAEGIYIDFEVAQEEWITPEEKQEAFLALEFSADVSSAATKEPSY